MLVQGTTTSEIVEKSSLTLMKNLLLKYEKDWRAHTVDYDNNKHVQLNVYFNSQEFQCHPDGLSTACGGCECSVTKINELLVYILVIIRSSFRKKVHINSAYRCKKHNAAIGGVSNSRHIQGLAADITVEDTDPLTVAKFVENLGVVYGIGWYPNSNFVHIDMREQADKAFWVNRGSEVIVSSFQGYTGSDSIPDVTIDADAMGFSESPINVGDIVTIKDESVLVYDTNVTAGKWVADRKWKVVEVDENNKTAKLGPRDVDPNTCLNQWYLKKDLIICFSDDGTSGSGNLGQIVWNKLLKAIGNKRGVAALMGNLYHESAMRPNNLEEQYESKLGYTDSSYTTAVDNGTYSNFVHDAAGYGLAQWTWHTRKESLLNLAKKKKVSIANLDMQIEYLLMELENSYYGKNTYLDILKSCKEDDPETQRAASNAILLGFENPSDTSPTVQETRFKTGLDFYNGDFSSCGDTNFQCSHTDDAGNSTIESGVGYTRETCNSDGFTGDTACSLCGFIESYGQLIPKRPHTYDWRGICLECHYIDPTCTFEETVSKQDLKNIRALLQQILKREV